MSDTLPDGSELLPPTEEARLQADWFKAVAAAQEVIKRLPMRYDPFVNAIARAADCDLDAARLVVADLEAHGFLHYSDHSGLERDFRIL